MSEVLTKQVFESEEDELLDYECEVCGHHVEAVDGEDIEACEECGSEAIIKTTSHEDEACSRCHQVFEMWEDAYRQQAYKQEDELLICENCFDKLPD